MRQNIDGLFIAAIFVGISLGGLMPLMSSALVRVFGAQQFGRAYGYVALVTLPCQLGPIIAAALYDRTGSYDLSFILSIGLLLLLIPASLKLRS